MWAQGLTWSRRNQILMIMRIHYQLALLTLLTLAGCTDSPSRPKGNVIAVSIHPVADIVRQIVGDTVEVETIIPPGKSPHGFSMTAKTLTKVRQARVLVVVGRGLDRVVEKAAADVGGDGMELLSVADLVTGSDGHDGHDHHEHAKECEDNHEHHGHDHSGPNPHMWLDPVLARKFVIELTEHLSEAFPEHASVFAANSETIAGELQVIHEEYEKGLGGIEQKHMITFHDSFDLLAERYGLEVVAHLSPVELRPGGEITLKRRREVIELIEKHKLTTIYFEPQFPQGETQWFKDKGARILQLDPLGNPNADGYKTFQQMMRTNLGTLIQGQSGK